MVALKFWIKSFHNCNRPYYKSSRNSLFFSFHKTIFKKAYYQKSLMKQIYVIIALLATITIGILHLNSGIVFAQNETSQIEDSSLITIPQIDKSMETNNTSPQGEDKIPLIE